MKPFAYSPLLTDFYQLTMAYGYWQLGMHEREAVFHLLFRKNPFKGNYALCCGLESVIDYLSNWQFQVDELNYLATLKNFCDQPLFSSEFLTYLGQLRFTCDIDAIPEGTVVFAHEPLLRIQGPLLQCQLLETPILNIINFQTLIATKATRVCRAAGDDPVIEFGMRRAQGPDGALSASRAAYIGGCQATSNTLAGKLFDIPVKGTHAHSWVSAFDNEMAAFSAYAQVLPHHAVLLVDTYDSIEGVKHAITIGKHLRAQHADLLAIRLDSGDLADLSIKARKLLDESGFKKTGILASNTLDEYVITSLKQQGACISSWGVGTNLATAFDQAALDGVYKLGALQNEAGEWQYKLKLSEQEIKNSNPGKHQVRRYFSNGAYVMDVIYDLSLGITETPETVLLEKDMQKTRLDDFDACVDLLVPVYRRGKLVLAAKSIHAIKQEATVAIKEFDLAHAQQFYAVSLEKNLHALKHRLMAELKTTS